MHVGSGYIHNRSYLYCGEGSEEGNNYSGKLLASNMWQSEVQLMRKNIAVHAESRRALREVDCFVLDNSLRESTVAQTRGHTFEDKLKIYEEVKKCGFKHIIVAAFSHMPRVEDMFTEHLAKSGEDLSTLYAFTEAFEKFTSDGLPDRESVPIGLQKMQKIGLKNPIIEIDLATPRIDWEKLTITGYCDLLLARMQWVRMNLSPNAYIFVNLRDFPDAMMSVPERVAQVVSYLSSLAHEKRPFGIIFEEPTGNFLPEEVGAWTELVRKLMDTSGWKSGNLLVHVHEKWAFAEATQLECLGKGANGIWASVCEEGAAVGHACSSVTLMNLVRFGNKKVLERYNCTELRNAAQNVTQITTGSRPHPKQPVYGPRALDLTFGFGGIAGGVLNPEEFDIAEFFGVERPIRINTLASAEMIVDRLKDLFGDDPQFNETTANEMKNVMLEDLRHNRKEEYMSKVGLAILFDRSGGKLTAAMSEAIAKMELSREHHELLIASVRKTWDKWDLRDEVHNDDCLEFDSFYNGFMIPFFPCYSCDNTIRALQAIDMDSDGKVDWNEFLVYLKWALRQYPHIDDIEELLDVTFTMAIIPAMRDELIKKAQQ